MEYNPRTETVIRDMARKGDSLGVFKMFDDIRVTLESEVALEQFIIKRACELFDVTKDELTSKESNRKIATARHFCGALIKQNTGMTLKQVGHVFNRDHATVLNNIKIHNNLNDTLFEYQEKVRIILEDIQNYLTE